MEEQEAAIVGRILFEISKQSLGDGRSLVKEGGEIVNASDSDERRGSWEILWYIRNHGYIVGYMYGVES